MSRVALLASLVGCVLAAFWFRSKQNRAHAMGGRISNPKLLWLFFAIWFWLFECAVLAFEPSLPQGYRLILGVHAASMWARGALEMVMLYVTRNWRPPIGITHDVLCIVTVLVLMVVVPLPLDSAWGLFAPALIFMLLFSLLVEVLYAALFFKAVEGKTTGEKGIWFASEDEARFKRINRITTAFNVPQVVFQLVLLGAAFVQ
ncbi:MAG: hypothetical protein Q8N23_08680 [Archangium sp.]|nr:hypothetical protein [Archangium sp.]MDP3152731.1 hypothetical protein [Archangium sp.]MDP3573518.1 hypothetical protein [Archangium sp.]